MVGSHHFNEIRGALPLISPSVLSQRLRSLEEDGVIRRHAEPGVAATYHLTPAGEELRPIVDALGQWARKWVRRDYRPDELDPAVLMWLLPRLRKYWWIVVDRAVGQEDEIDVCMTDPGHPVALLVTATVRTLVDVLMGDARLDDVRRQGLLAVEGERQLGRRFEALFESERSDSYAGAGRLPG